MAQLPKWTLCVIYTVIIVTIITVNFSLGPQQIVASPLSPWGLFHFSRQPWLYDKQPCGIHFSVLPPGWQTHTCRSRKHGEDGNTYTAVTWNKCTYIRTPPHEGFLLCIAVHEMCEISVLTFLPNNVNVHKFKKNKLIKYLNQLKIKISMNWEIMSFLKIRHLQIYSRRGFKYWI